MLRLRAASSLGLGCYHSQGIPWELTRKILFQEICPLMKANFTHLQKSHLFYKKTINQCSLYLAILKTLSNRNGVILTLIFPDNINFLEELLCNWIHFSAHFQRSALFQIKINAVQNHWMSSNVVVSPHRKRLFFAPLGWSCFWHVSDSSSLVWLVPGCSTFYKP